MISLIVNIIVLWALVSIGKGVVEGVRNRDLWPSMPLIEHATVGAQAAWKLFIMPVDKLIKLVAK